MVEKSQIITLVSIVVLLTIVMNILIRNNPHEVSVDGESIIDKIPDTTLDDIKQLENDMQKAPDISMVEIYQKQFIPENITVKKGSIIMWTNKDIKNHKLAAKTVLVNGSTFQEFYGDNIPPEGTYNHTFNTVGVFPYFDIAALKYLRGIITVVE